MGIIFGTGAQAVRICFSARARSERKARQGSERAQRLVKVCGCFVY